MFTDDLIAQGWFFSSNLSPQRSEGSRAYIFNLRLSPDGSRLLINCDDTQLWDLTTRQLVWVMNENRGADYYFSKNSKFLFAEGVDYAGMTAFMPYEIIVDANTGHEVYFAKYSNELAQDPYEKRGTRPNYGAVYKEFCSQLNSNRHLLIHPNGQILIAAEYMTVPYVPCQHITIFQKKS